MNPIMPTREELEIGKRVAELYAREAVPSTPGARGREVLPHELTDLSVEQLIHVYKKQISLHHHIVIELRLRGIEPGAIAGDLGISKSTIYSIEYNERRRRARASDD